jgi:integrase
MAGRRALNSLEERTLLSVVRSLPPRDRCLITALWFTGFRISEILSLTIGSVVRNREIVSKIGIEPRNMKGGYGRTRWVPVLPELRRALHSNLGWLRRRLELSPAMPLFISRECDEVGNLRPLTRESARRKMHAAYRAAAIENDGRLGTHTLRKTWARKVYRNSGNDIMILKAALNHSDVSITQKYLEVDEDEVMAAIKRCDFTRRPKAPKQTIQMPVV